MSDRICCLFIFYGRLDRINIAIIINTVRETKRSCEIFAFQCGFSGNHHLLENALCSFLILVGKVKTAQTRSFTFNKTAVNAVQLSNNKFEFSTI